MAESYGDVVLDFDLDFLHQNISGCAVPNKLEKLKKQVLLAKKKTIAIDSLVRKFYEKREEKIGLEKQLLESKDECKQVCINYKNAMQKLAYLEEKDEKFEKSNRELQEAFNLSENRCHAIQSHANQLELLIKERETKMEALEIEHQLEKCCKQEVEKKVTSLEKEVSFLENKVSSLGRDKDILYEHVCILRDVALGKKKICKEVKLLLDKYKSCKSEEPSDNATSDNENIEDNLYEEHVVPSCQSAGHALDVIDNSNDTEIIRVIVLSDSAQKGNVTDMPCSNENKHDLHKEHGCDMDSESSNGIVTSTDTGRGSSLTYSDSDKCLNSPEHYSNDSLLSSDTIIKNKPLDIVQEQGHGFSKIAHDNGILVSNDQKLTSFKDLINSASLKKHIQVSDLATNLVARVQTAETYDFSSNEVNSNLTNDTAQIEITVTSPGNHMIQTSNYSDYENDNYLSKTIGHENALEGCFKQNNVCLDNENSEDYEISNILNTMSLHRNLITPLPPSPDPTSITNLLENTADLDNSESSRFAMLFNCFSKILKDINELKSSVPSATNLKKIVNEVCDERDRNKKKTLNLSDATKHKHRNAIVIHDKEEENSTTIDKDIPVSDSDLVIDEDLRTVDNIDDNNASEKEQRVVDRLLFDEPSLSDDGRHSSLNLETEEEVDLIMIPPGRDNCDTSIALNDVSDNKNVRRNTGKSKMSKLQKLRKRLQPKNKIKSPDRPIKKRKSLKILPRLSSQSTDPTTLNSKAAYEKALAVVAEFRTKQKLLLNKKIKLRNRVKEHKTTSDKESAITKQNNKSTTTQSKEYVKPVAGIKYTDLQKNKPHKETESNNYIEFRPIQKTYCIQSNWNNNSTDTTVQSNEPKCNTTDKNSRNLGSITSSSSAVTHSERKEEITDSHTQYVVSDSRNRNKTPEPVNDFSQIDHSSVSSKDESPVKLKTGKNSLKRPCAGTAQAPTKRILRSSSLRLTESEKNSNNKDSCTEKNLQTVLNNVNKTNEETLKHCTDSKLIPDKAEDINDPRNSLLCKMIEKYGISKTYLKQVPKLPEKILNRHSKKLEDSIKRISELQASDVNKEMDKLVDDILGWKHKLFIQVLIKYLKDPERKSELFQRVNNPPGPPMTIVEQILLYVITQLQTHWPTIVSAVLRNIEYTIFRFNQTPEFDIIESMSHFYAVLCRYTRAKRRLRLFMLDAMYCIAFKAIPLIKQCIDVWMHVLPLAHMGIAKTPLVVCVVYLLHFYKCEDPFNRVQTMRYILQHKFSYEMGEWNETQILELFNNAILELRENPLEKKMLRIALILLAKRNGPKWTLKNIVKNMLLSSIERDNLPDRIKQFCIALLGPILKPFPQDMKVHCEIVINQLIDMLKQTHPHEIEESVIKSLVYINKHNPTRVSQTLFTWKPQKAISQELEELLRDFIRDRPIKVWVRTVSKLDYCSN